MKAQELRIGNYIKSGEIELTTTYHEIRIQTLSDCRQLNGYDSYEPIELTEDWLLKFGFTKDDNILVRSFRKVIVNNALCLKELIVNLDCMNQYIFLKETSFGKDKKQDIITLFNQDLSDHPIYVHKLQNIWFGLTEKELTINK